MKTINQGLFVTVLSFTFLFAVILSGCKNNATGNEEDHSDPFGLVLYMNGAEIAKQQDGIIVTDELHVGVGEETDLITVYFLDDEGDEFQPADEDLFLGWIISNESIAEIEQHEEDGKWRFHLAGLEEGETTVQFSLEHGVPGDSHSDFTSMEFTIHVN